ncbi:MAG: hypothetical protein K2L45_05040 [Muribaculaceae bacterium]|nr:hypothetical protein [Muribaculaceae bacterium]
MKTLLKVLGWIFIFIAVVGGPQTIVRNHYHWTMFIALGIYVLLAWLCFCGAKRLKKKENDIPKQT